MMLRFNYKKINKIIIYVGNISMNKYLNLTLENIDDEHICCAIGDKKHQVGVEKKKKTN